jgi:hypothetical protein
MLYQLANLEQALKQIACDIREALARISGPEFAAQHPSARFPAMAGAYEARLSGVEECLELVMRTIGSEVKPEIDRLERLWKAYGSLVCDDRIEEEDLVDLERLALDPQYQTDRRFLAGKITEALGEARDNAREREQANVIEMLTAAGFVWNESETFEGWERHRDAINPADGSVGKFLERVTIESLARRRDTDETWYVWAYESAGFDAASGTSGEFSRLLEAVGISRAVEAKP